MKEREREKTRECEKGKRTEQNRWERKKKQNKETSGVWGESKDRRNQDCEEDSQRGGRRGAREERRCFDNTHTKKTLFFFFFYSGRTL